MNKIFEDHASAKSELETEMTEALTGILTRFYNRAGMVPDAISVHLRSIQQLGVAGPKFVDCAVVVDHLCNRNV